MTTELITACSTAALLIIAAIVTGTISIIKAIHENSKVTVVGQQVEQARGKVRDKKIQEIHILTNSRLTAALKLIMVMAKKESLRTGKADDLAIFESAQIEVQKADEATQKILVRDENDADLVAAHIAEQKLAKLAEKLVPLN